MVKHGKRKFMCAALLLLLALWPAGTVLALPGEGYTLRGEYQEGHNDLWNRAFGVADPQSRKNIQPLWDAAQKVIDDTEREYRPDRTDFQWLDGRGFGGAKHRYLFHWGFNATPDDHRGTGGYPLRPGGPDAERVSETFLGRGPLEAA